MATAEAVHDRLARAIDSGWLTEQRWFRAKRRPVAAAMPHDAVQLPGTDGWLVVVSVQYADGGDDRYLLPLSMAETFREPRDGEGVWRALAAHILDGGELAASRGTFSFEPTPAIHELLADGAATLHRLGERRLSVEQSNSSVVLGDRLILKLYRLMEPGENPDLEVSAFLTAAGFRHTPPLGGFAAYLPDDDASCAATMLQAYLPADGDGWAWAVRTLTAPDGRQEAISGVDRIGAMTAELHRTLASQPDHPGFPARAATATELAAWRASAERQLDGALAALHGADHARLERLVPAIRKRLAVLGSATGADTSRIHGDYHLGQLLHTADGFAVIDFEGEPARPLAERREPASPLRDVAGMLRSFDYAARTAASRLGEPASAWDGWLAEARDAFLGAYGAIGPSDAELLAAFELEKACYEVRYEANNRPDWIWLPLEALERLAS